MSEKDTYVVASPINNSDSIDSITVTLDSGRRVEFEKPIRVKRSKALADQIEFDERDVESSPHEQTGEL